MSAVATLCPYCGVGCGLVAQTRDGRLERVDGDVEHPASRGRFCSKPRALPDAAHTADRATVPLWRPSRQHRWRATTWDAVLGELAQRLRGVRAEHGAEAIAFYVSGQLLTEDVYAVTKLAKGFLGTNNVDSNSRLCMASAVAGYTGAFGADGPPASYEDVDRADCLLLLGTNAAACHPVLWTRVRDRQAAGASVIVVDPRRTETAAAADVHLRVRPGTDVALLNGMLHAIERDGLVDAAFVAARTDGWAAASAVAAEWPPERAAAVCGVPPELIVAAARRFARAPAALALWSMGANQSRAGTLKNHALINLCLATGHVGRPGAGPLSLTGQPNAMGGREVGVAAHLLPGYRSVASATDREAMRRAWRLPATAGGIAPQPGLPATELFDALEDGRVRAVWICGTNPVVSMPDADRARAALRRAELVVCQDAYHPTETSALAHALLPAAQWPEKEGVMTSSERRIGLVRRALEPPGEALADWEVFARLARALGFGDWFAWDSPAAVYDEFAACTAGRPCDQSGVSHARLRRERSVQWPCPAGAGERQHPGTTRLYEDGRFPTRTGRAQFVATPYVPPAEGPTRDFPFVLTTGRVASHWHTLTRTGKSPALLASEHEPFVEVSPHDAEAAGVTDGDLAQLTSARGSARLRVRVTDSVPRGTLFAPFHWGSLHAPPGAGTVNALTTRVADPTSHQPELKACAVRLAPAAPAPRTRRRARRLLIVGAGMAGVATAEALLDHAEPGAWRISIAGREPAVPYRRTLLARALAGRADPRALPIHPPGWYRERGIELLLGNAVERLDVERRRAHTSAGERLEFDALAIATGSLPTVPPIAGAERPAVHVLRTRADMDAIRAAARPGRRVVVVGGGVLGVEVAAALAPRRLRVTLVHALDRLMEQQLDAVAAELVAAELRERGVDVLLERLTIAIAGGDAGELVQLSDGTQLEADLVVFATGVRPAVELARAAGLEAERGIAVDDELRTSAPGVWAVGECAEHRGVAYGVWAPLREQARVAGASIAGVPAAFHGALPLTTLDVAGLELLAAGRASARAGEREVVVHGDRGDAYRKLVLADGAIVGATLLGREPPDGRLVELVRSAGRADASVLTDPARAAAPPGADATIACSCNRVTRASVVAAVRGGVRSVDAVSEATGAGAGCGGCRWLIGELIADAS